MPYRSTDINANLTKAAAAVPDVLQILRFWDPDSQTIEELRESVVEENILGKSSRSRARDVFERVFRRRYVPEESERPARLLHRLVVAGTPRDIIDRLLYYYAALSEHLLYRAAVELIYEHRNRGRQGVSKEEMREFIKALPRGSGEDAPYSDAVLDKLAQRALTALRDFGILEGRINKEIAPVRVPDEVVGFVVYALMEEGHSAKRIIENRDWRLFLLGKREVENRISDVANHGYFTYRAAGDIRRFDWTHDSLGDYVNAIST